MILHYFDIFLIRLLQLKPDICSFWFDPANSASLVGTHHYISQMFSLNVSVLIMVVMGTDSALC